MSDDFTTSTAYNDVNGTPLVQFREQNAPRVEACICMVVILGSVLGFLVNKRRAKQRAASAHRAHSR